MTHIDTNAALARWADTKPSSKGKDAKSTAATARMLNVLKQLKTQQGAMRCGRFYAWDTKENGMVRLGHDHEQQILKLFRRGYLQRVGERLLPTELGEKALAVRVAKGKTSFYKPLNCKAL